MKKIVLGIFISVISATSFAGNGTHIIGLSPQGRAMGGTGVGGMTSATEALYKNPALLGALLVPPGEMVFEPMAERNALEFSASITDLNANAFGTDSTAGIIPNGSLAWARRIDNRFTIGVGVFGFAGTAFKFASGIPTFGSAEDQFKVFRIVPALTYVFGNTVSIGLAPVVSVGMFRLDVPAVTNGPVREDFSTAVQLGAWFRPWEFMQMGVAYVSPTRHVYKDVIDLDKFAGAPAAPNEDITITEPHEFAVGTYFNLGAKLEMALDYRLILWGNATGYSNFLWKAQHVLGVGFQYYLNRLRVRAGYNFGTNPLRAIPTQAAAGTSPYENKDITNSAIIVLDGSVFAGIIQHHVTAGVGYYFSDTVSLDASFVWSPTSKLALTTIGAPDTSVSKWEATLGGTIRF